MISNLDVIKDKRSKKIVIVSHCIINQNSKLEGIALRPGVINEVLDVIVKYGCGILQMPCPEILYEGIGRFDKSYEQYETSCFFDICNKIVKEVVDQIENYIKWNYKIVAILAVDGSPSCGYNLTQSAPEWKGLIAGINWQKVRYVNKPGVLFKILIEELKKRNIDIPIIGIPEIPELGSIKDSIDKLEKLINS
jgi:predicted secreted protein